MDAINLALHGNYVFASLPEEDVETVVRKMHCVTVRARARARVASAAREITLARAVSPARARARARRLAGQSGRSDHQAGRQGREVLHPAAGRREHHRRRHRRRQVRRRLGVRRARAHLRRAARGDDPRDGRLHALGGRARDLPQDRGRGPPGAAEHQRRVPQAGQDPRRAQPRAGRGDRSRARAGRPVPRRHVHPARGRRGRGLLPRRVGRGQVHAQQARRQREGAHHARPRRPLWRDGADARRAAPRERRRGRRDALPQARALRLREALRAAAGGARAADAHPHPALGAAAQAPARRRARPALERDARAVLRAGPERAAAGRHAQPALLHHQRRRRQDHEEHHRRRRRQDGREGGRAAPTRDARDPLGALSRENVPAPPARRSASSRPATTSASAR